MRRTAAILAALGVLAAGCGDPTLWARWRIERALYHAQARERRVLARGSLARDADFAPLERRFAAIAAAYPASRWAAAPSGPARDVALAAARAAYEQASIAARRGGDDRAEALWAKLEVEDAALPGIVIASRLARARALDRLGRYDEALAERAALAAMDPTGDPDRVGPSADVLEAPLVLASELRARGRDAAADSALRGADAHLSAALARGRGADVLPLAEGVSRVRAARGDAAGALAALRVALPGAADWEVPERAQGLAARALEAGAPESVVAYSRWAASQSDTRRVAGQAWLVAAQAWERLGQPDSALADYDAILSRWTDPGALGPVARFRRADLLDRLGEWERARAEYLALQAAYPTHPLAFTSAQRIVRHHVEVNEPELARLAAQAAILNIDHLLATNRDRAVQRDGGLARAQLLLTLGRPREAEDALVQLWRSFPQDSAAQAGALQAAALATARAGGVVRADSIRAGLRRNASSATVRLAAGAAGAAGRHTH